MRPLIQKEIDTISGGFHGFTHGRHGDGAGKCVGIQVPQRYFGVTDRYSAVGLLCQNILMQQQMGGILAAIGFTEDDGAVGQTGHSLNFMGNGQYIVRNDGVD